MKKKLNKFYNICEAIMRSIESSEWAKKIADNEELRVAVTLMKEIKAKFPDREIYIVGGVPRDILTGDKIDDVDLATNIPFEYLDREGYDLHNISKNDSQPVYKINYGGYSLDLAQFRKDEAGAVGRNDNISTTIDDFETDTKRRDLTINSFGLNEKGEIVDYQGGIEDLENKIIRTVGDAKDRFREDATRILRVARFAAKMGFKIEDKTRAAMIALKDILSDKKMISSESIAKEFYKASKSGPVLRRFIEHLLDTRIAHDILPELTAMEDMWHDTEHHPEAEGNVLGHILECLSVSRSNDPVINLAILFHDFGKAVTQAFKTHGSKVSSFHGHEGAGVDIVRAIFNRLRFNELSAENKKGILFAVERHMLIHNLTKLAPKTLASLVNSPYWYIIKEVGYADAASRTGKFDALAFKSEIEYAEDTIKKLGDAEALRTRIKEFIDGRKLMNWFPIFQQNNSLIGKILPQLQDHVLNEINAGRSPSDDELKAIVQNFLQSQGY